MKKQKGCEKYYIGKTRYGWGVFAAREIKKGEKILAMKGEKISSDDLSKVGTSGRNVLVDPLQIGDNTFLNLHKPYLLVNHSCNPNSGFKKRLTLFAIKNIKKDEEITFDYSTTWFEGFKCDCGEPNCRGYITSFQTIPKKTLRKYIKSGIVPKFILKKIK